jgi:membrane protein
VEALPSRGTAFVRRLVVFLRAIWAGIERDDVGFYAAGIAYHGLFSIFAVFLLLTLLLSLVGVEPSTLRALIHFTTGLVPERAEELVNSALAVMSAPAPGPLLLLSILFTLWTASNVIQAIIHALNRIYHVRDEDARPAWQSRLIALGVVGASAVCLTFGFLVLIFGEDVARHSPEIGHVWPAIATLLHNGRQPISLVIVFLGAFLVYWLAPSFGHQHRVSWPGAVVFTVMWILATALFNLYLRQFAVYDKAYGPFATVIVVLVWVYLSAYVCLLGGEVNAALGHLRSQRG